MWGENPRGRKTGMVGPCNKQRINKGRTLSTNPKKGRKK
jgi:hypothetical protein